MRILWLRAALNDLSAIRDYIARDNPAAARRVLNTIRTAVESLSYHPRSGRAGRLPETRELVVGRYPYIVAYRIIQDDIQILSVIHTSRRWPEQLE